ncbi:uncharacterized protein LOC126982272 [Eriocheir sinensis]|uniref:uncharacterized protein LOC126982272 n=1 Tax=Eriocheir sinensis TaxID=95602 RepID=UPI0021C6DF11|nr:uncharacterized protein LOC126982272 [Eriocheir sinensis]
MPPARQREPRDGNHRTKGPARVSLPITGTRDERRVSAASAGKALTTTPACTSTSNTLPGLHLQHSPPLQPPPPPPTPSPACTSTSNTLPGLHLHLQHPPRPAPPPPTPSTACTSSIHHLSTRVAAHAPAITFNLWTATKKTPKIQLLAILPL